MAKKINIFLAILSVVLLIFGVVLVSKPIAFGEVYKSERSETAPRIELQFYEGGTVKSNTATQFYQVVEDLSSGKKIIKIGYDELVIVNFYKLEYTRWDVETQRDITTYLVCSSRITEVIIIFVADFSIIGYVVVSTIKQRKQHL